ncbi:MAG: zf-HC2 domain-containing protein [Ardenticatenia bacterium]|nr:zf-HC2 domain-containing protein [Ardenticatenia bacterium]
MSLSPEEPCRRWLAHLCDYVDGELDQSLCAELERHMAECEACTVVVETTRQTITLYRHLGRAELPEATRRRLKQLIERSVHEQD